MTHASSPKAGSDRHKKKSHKSNKKEGRLPKTGHGSKDAPRQNDKTPPQGLQLRQAAAKILSAVIDKKTSLDGLLDKTGGHKAFKALEERDQALVRAILTVTLRHHGEIAQYLAQLLAKPLPAGARSLEHVLQIGAAQILYLDIPNHAAIDLAVESAKRNPQTQRFASLVNAVLRSLTRKLDKQKQANAAGEDSSLKKPTIEISRLVPEWFWQMLVRDYGEEKATLIVEAQAIPAPLDITVKDTPSFWADKLDGEVLPFGSVRLNNSKTAISELAGFDIGAWWVQNVAASLPARLMGQLRGKRTADLCAAPGGKTAQLACAGAEVTAVDVSANRLKRLKQNMARLQLQVATWQGDLRKMTLDDEFQPFDAILLDAPCSSTGTIRRHPDVLWTKTAADIAKLADVQAELLSQSLALVRSGGLIMFCNCSLAKQEGEVLLTQFLQKHHDKVKLVPFVQEELMQLNPEQEQSLPLTWDKQDSLITQQGFLRTTPADLPNEDRHLAGMDGFFAARLQKL